jgi:hypothetical protein
MHSIDTSLPELSQLIEQRLALLRTLAESLELGSVALVQNDAQSIARGAAHQAELCRQWSCLEEQLRSRTRQHSTPRANEPGNSDLPAIERLPPIERSIHLQADWEALSARIRYLMRVHSSLLRHLQRSLAVMSRVVDTCAPTYTADPGLLRTEVLIDMRTEAVAGGRTQARTQAQLWAGE